QARRAVKPVPPRKDDAEIGEIFFANVGMVNAVHPRRDEYLVHRALDGEREPHIAVMEKRAQLESDLVHDVDRERRPDENQLNGSEGGRKADLHEMKAKRRAHVEIRIDMVDVMKSP